MRLLRIAVLVLFVVCLGLNIWATARYNAGRDTVRPVITSETEYLEITVSGGEEAIMQGLTATDEQDGDLTEHIMLSSRSRFQEPGVFTAQYVVFDSHQNFATLSRKICYTDYTSPRFSLSRPLVYTRGSNVRYLDYVRAQDVLDGDISGKIKVKASAVSNYTAGIYPILLEVANTYGDTVEVELSVVITEGQSNGPVIELKEYLTYLEQGETFDPETLITSVRTKKGDALSRDKVSVLGSVDTQIPGCYQLVYSCEHEGNEGRTYLTVVVTGEVDG